MRAAASPLLPFRIHSADRPRADLRSSGVAVITVVATHFGSHRESQTLVAIVPSANPVGFLSNPWVAGLLGAAAGAGVAAAAFWVWRRRSARERPPGEPPGEGPELPKER